MRMRRGAADARIVSGANGAPAGICLGWNFFAEHQLGIEPMLAAFGVVERRVTKVPKDLRYFRRGAWTYLIYQPDFMWEPERACTKRNLDRMIDYAGSRDDFGTAWSNSAFGIRIKGGLLLKSLYEAIVFRKALIYFALTHEDPLGLHGPCLMFAPKTSDPVSV